MRYALGRPLDADPGTKHAYSNVGYLLLGRAIETASGRKYEDFSDTVLTKLEKRKLDYLSELS